MLSNMPSITITAPVNSGHRCENGVFQDFCRGRLANRGNLNKLPFPQDPKECYGTFLAGISRVPRLSIVIPSVGDCNLLEDSLVSVLENRPADCEVLVVHNRPYDDPYNLAGEVRFVQANPRAGLAECLDMGTAAGRHRSSIRWPAAWRFSPVGLTRPYSIFRFQTLPPLAR